MSDPQERPAPTGPAQADPSGGRRRGGKAKGPRPASGGKAAPAGRAGGKGSADRAGRAGGSDAPGVAVRRLAADALVRIHEEGAYANLVLPALLERSGLDERDRGLVTQLVYDTTRRRRACDWLVDRFVLTDPDPDARALLRLGADQLAFSDVPRHAAVDATVAAAPRRLRGFVNAVLRRLADDLAGGEPAWPDLATRLSYPDWVVDRLRADLGEADAEAALEAMDLPGRVHRRPDGYTQDLASQWVVEAVGARQGERVADLCAAPGGKATGLAASGALVVAGDVRASRVGLVTDNVARLGLGDRVAVVRADGTAPPLRAGAFDRVLVDAPCSGLGVLGRRADARWRIAAGDVAELAALQRRLVAAALALVRPGGVLVYSACTLTTDETVSIDEHLARLAPDLEPLDRPDGPWRGRGRGAQLLPQDAGTDGMFLLRLRVPGPDPLTVPTGLGAGVPDRPGDADGPGEPGEHGEPSEPDGPGDDDHEGGAPT